LKKKDIAKRLGLSQNVVNACIQEMIDKGTIKSITHPHGRWQVPKDLVQRREQAVIEGRAAGKSNGQIADELGLDLSGVEKIASRLIEEGRILRRSPVPSAPREPPVINLPVVDRTPHVSSDPLAGLGDLISRLQTIPGIKVNVTIGISLGVGQ
jgi:DNA-binding CsgD family transcriptional regulator